MAKRKRKTLPKNFEELLETADIEKLKSVFDNCDVDAYGGTLKYTALGFNNCPDDLARWLVEQGANMAAVNHYEETPLHARAGHWQGRIAILLELGADVCQTDQRGNTPLHDAAAVGHIENAKLLLDHGANADTENDSGLTALAYALQRCSNTKIAQVADMAELLLDRQPAKEPESVGFLSRFFGGKKSVASPVTGQMKDFVRRIGTDFEFHRSNFNSDTLDAQSAGLDKLYALFDVPPVPRRAMHDGKSAIVPEGNNLADRHQHLWELLVPSSGAANTVQGEVIRISGKIHDELQRNGGVNWDRDFRKMADAYLGHISSAKSLPERDIERAKVVIADINKRESDTTLLCDFAVEWVSLNPKSTDLQAPSYDR